MAAITATNIKGPGWKVMTPIVLGASDTLVYDATKDPTLVLVNNTVGALTPLIDGDEAPTALAVSGAKSVDLSAGVVSASVPAGDAVALRLRDIFQYLKGTITITGADGMDAYLLER